MIRYSLSLGTRILFARVLLNLCGWCSYSKVLPYLGSCYLASRTAISDDVVWNSAAE